MPRARNIKPGFFTNEDLAEIAPMGRLLFIGLWTLADREGRLEDRPKRIKGALFPYDTCDVDSLLNDLQGFEFIKRYEVAGKKYIQILNFSKHQHPHMAEKQSEIPPMEEQAPNLRHASTVQAPDLHDTNPSESMILITDILNTEDNILSPEGDTQAAEIPYQEIVDHYHMLCPSLQRVKGLSPARKTAIRARFMSLGCDMAKLDEFLLKVERSDFITGRNGKWDGIRGIDWIFKQGNFLKIQEGNYDNGGDKHGSDGDTSAESVYAKAFGGV